AATFWLYAGLNLAFLVFTWLLVPETKGVTLEHIERNLMRGVPLKELGR
ncbi:MAG: MFS transporter, partial [Rudaea sp.]